jgi:trans-aconitate methyltransferase
MGPPRPSPLQHRPAWDIRRSRTSQYSQANRGRENQGGSQSPLVDYLACVGIIPIQLDREGDQLGRLAFEMFGRFATEPLPPVQMAGRYLIQAQAEKLMPIDIAQKLELDLSDRLLDIGCGPGANLIPLSFLVHAVTGVDHPLTIDHLSSRIRLSNVEYISGNFIDLNIEKKFTKILIYSVIQYLASESEIITFLERALDLLEPGGRMLVGDLPNTDLRRRFLASDIGRQFQKEWEQHMRDTAGGPSKQEPSLCEFTDPDSIQFDDRFVARLLERFRTATTHAWLLPQPPHLPFGHTREDLLILKM